MTSETPLEVPTNEPCSPLPDLPESHPKETATDTWSTRERLCLASSVLRSGDQDWMSVSSAIRPLGEPNRPNDWFSQKNCALQYADLLEKVESLKLLREDIQSIVSGAMDGDLVALLESILVEDVPAETIDRELENLPEVEQQLEVLNADVQPPSCSKTVLSSSMQEMQRNSSQSEHREPDSMVGSPISIEVEDALTSQAQEKPEVKRPCTPQPKVVSSLPHVTSCTPPAPPVVSTSLLTSLLKSPTPSSPVSSVTGLRSLTPSPLHPLREQSSPRSQLATCTLSPSTSSTTVCSPPTCSTADRVLRSSILQMSPHSATSSGPKLSKLLELPPSTPGGCLPSGPYLTASPAVLSPVASQVTTFSPLKSSNGIDTTSDYAKFTAENAKFTDDDAKFTVDDAKCTAGDAQLTACDARLTAGDALLTADDSRFTADDAMLTTDDARFTAGDAMLTADDATLITDDARVPGLVLSPVKQTVEGMTVPLVSEPSETPCEVPIVETVESQPEPLPAPSLAPKDPMKVIEDVPEDVPPREMKAKVASKEEVMEENVDRTVSPAEGEPVMETVAAEEMVVESVIEDSLSSSIIVDDDKESVQLEPEHGTCAEQETKPESEVNKEAVEAPVEEACLESGSKDKDDRDEKDDMDYQPAADESDSAKDAAKSEANNDEAPLESPDVLSKKDEQTPEDDLQEDPQVTADEDESAEESKDACSAITISSALSEDDLQEDSQLTPHEDDSAEKSKDACSTIIIISSGSGEETMYETQTEDDERETMCDTQTEDEEKETICDTQTEEDEDKDTQYDTQTDDDKETCDTQTEDEGKETLCDTQTEDEEKETICDTQTEEDDDKDTQYDTQTDDDKETCDTQTEDEGKETLCDTQTEDEEKETICDTQTEEDDDKDTQYDTQTDDDKETCDTQTEDDGKETLCDTQTEDEGKETQTEEDEETMYETQTEDDGVDKLRDDKSSFKGEDSESVRDYKVWKKSIMLVWRAAANHKFANVFLRPVTEEMAPGYLSIVHRPMDLLTIKKNIKNGSIRTTFEFQRDMMLMFQNAIMYNNSDHYVFDKAIEMREEVMRHIQVFLATQSMQTTETKMLRGRDGRVRKVEYSLDDKVSGPSDVALLTGTAHSSHGRSSVLNFASHSLMVNHHWLPGETNRVMGHIGYPNYFTPVQFA
ncbi:uncharacterized protein LOC119176601 isoform X3 [Rhipicephalus microplus]|uniref:uncharacterized protein LOC119176601 isoform X3 n=1 Tax=Rhipicephalus microplus TaxID=6941 RepID=UPI003F6ABB5F